MASKEQMILDAARSATSKSTFQNIDVPEVRKKLKSDTAEAKKLQAVFDTIIKQRNGVDAIGVYNAEGECLFKDTLVRDVKPDQESQRLAYNAVGRASRTMLRHYREIVQDSESVQGMRSFFGDTYSLRVHLFSEAESKLRYFTIRDLHEKLDVFLIFITLEISDYSHSDFTVNVQQAIDAVRETVGLAAPK